MSLRREFKVLTAPDGLKGLELVLREQPEPGGHRPHDAGHRRPRADAAAARGPAHPPHPHPHAHRARRARRPREGARDRRARPTSRSPSRRASSSPARGELVQGRGADRRPRPHPRMESLEMVAAGLAHEINNPLNYAARTRSRACGSTPSRCSALAARPATRPLDARGAGRRSSGRRRASRSMLGVADSGVDAHRPHRRAARAATGAPASGARSSPLDAWDAVRTVVGVVLPATGRARRGRPRPRGRRDARVRPGGVQPGPHEPRPERHRGGARRDRPGRACRGRVEDGDGSSSR